MKLFFAVNPNWTGRGQSWPCQLWPQIAGKLLKYLIFFYLFLQKRLPDLFELLTWPQKIRFWHPFWCISAGFHCYYRSPEAGRSPAGHWSTVWCGASKKFQSVSGRGPCRVWGEAGSQLGVLSLSFQLDSRRRTNLGNFPKPAASIAQWHIIHATLFVDRALSI